MTDFTELYRTRVARPELYGEPLLNAVRGVVDRPGRAVSQPTLAAALALVVHLPNSFDFAAAATASSAPESSLLYLLIN